MCNFLSNIRDTVHPSGGRFDGGGGSGGRDGVVVVVVVMVMVVVVVVVVVVGLFVDDTSLRSFLYPSFCVFADFCSN